MAIILLIALAALVLVAVVATLVQVARDGYRSVPTRPELLRRPESRARSGRRTLGDAQAAAGCTGHARRARPDLTPRSPEHKLYKLPRDGQSRSAGHNSLRETPSSAASISIEKRRFDKRNTMNKIEKLP